MSLRLTDSAHYNGISGRNTFTVTKRVGPGARRSRDLVSQECTHPADRLEPLPALVVA